MRRQVSALLTLGVLTTAATIVLPRTAHATTQSPTYYVSLGDSYSVGYQPNAGATPGYAGYVAHRTQLTLANFGCAGATTTSILDAAGCPVILPHTAGGMTYPTTTQIAAAQSFITRHAGHIGLITVSIGGNDVVGCAERSNPVPCVTTAVNNIRTNVTTLASDLRAVAGPQVPIIGSTYPDVILGTYIYPRRPAPASTVNLAMVSVTAFKLLVNPALSKGYTSASGSFVDVTAATGAYTSLNRTVHTKRYGEIPVPVASVCALTWFCTRGDIHARTAGYNLIGKLIVSRYSAMRKR
jgi:lysophospholipase L1-like esterase